MTMSTMGGIPTPLTLQEIEREKNKVDLRPDVTFIKNNWNAFSNTANVLLDKEPTEFGQEWVQGIKFSGEDHIEGPQINPERARGLLERMPEALQRMSRLKEVDYQYANEVIVPVFKENGALLKSEWVPLKNFEAEHLNESRVLVGFSAATGEVIHPSAIPKSVWITDMADYRGMMKDLNAGDMEQFLVFLHEFFHTAEYPLRNPPEQREKVVLEIDGKQFTFQQWWEDFENLFLSHVEKPVSRYAAIYEKALNQTAKRTEYEEYTTAMGEQMCESFVAYQLNIISNGEGWTNFREARPQTWQLMDTLCRAKLIKKGDKIEV